MSIICVKTLSICEVKYHTQKQLNEIKIIYIYIYIHIYLFNSELSDGEVEVIGGHHTHEIGDRYGQKQGYYISRYHREIHTSIIKVDIIV
jgi:hypothetical protein